jgi:hypothetical protein
MRLTTFVLPALVAFVPAFAQEGEASDYVSNLLEALK